jgi:hypothetical protein
MARSDSATGQSYGSVLSATSFGTKESLVKPCVDCGLLTGCFCDGEEFESSGKPCFAEVHHPFSGEQWQPGQRTPLCSKCDAKFGKCHYCRKVPFCMPFANQKPSSALSSSVRLEQWNTGYGQRLDLQETSQSSVPLPLFSPSNDNGSGGLVYELPDYGKVHAEVYAEEHILVPSSRSEGPRSDGPNLAGGAYASGSESLPPDSEAGSFFDLWSEEGSSIDTEEYEAVREHFGGQVHVPAAAGDEPMPPAAGAASWKPSSLPDRPPGMPGLMPEGSCFIPEPFANKASDVIEFRRMPEAARPKDLVAHRVEPIADAPEEPPGLSQK